MTDNQKNVRDAAILGVAAHQAPQRLLGYHKIYHGTRKDIAAKIRKEGLDPKYGGTGAAKKASGINPGFVGSSKGHVHFSRSPVVARLYATFTGGLRGKVVKGRITDRAYRRAKLDHDGAPIKHFAAKTTHKISPDNLDRGKGIKAVVNARTLKSYIKNNPGRFLRGAALAGAGATAGTALARRVANKTKE